MNLASQKTGMSILAGFLRLLLVLGMGLLLGAVGVLFVQENLLLCLCPLLLGISVVLILRKRDRSRWGGVLGAATLAWIGFYLAFVVIGFRVHLLYYSDPPQTDCSPCFFGPDLDPLFFAFIIGFFFLVGLGVVVITVLVTNRLFLIAQRAKPKE